MARKWISSLSITYAAAASILAAASLTMVLIRPSDILMPEMTKKKSSLPKRHFAFAKESYDAIALGALSIKYAPPTMQLPDLRQYLTYYGTNGRPDVATDKTMLHFALANHKVPASTGVDEPLYLHYDKTQNPAHYVFSPNNTPHIALD